MSVTIDVDLRDKLEAAREQGQRPTCLVFAISAAHEFKRGGTEYLSPEYLHYAGAQRTHKDPTQGLSRPAVREALLQDGQPLDVEWPYQSEAPAVSTWRPPATVQATHKAAIIFAVRTVEDVRALVKSGTPVTLHVMATEAMYSPDAQGVVRARKRDRPTARHALLAVGSGHADDGEYLLVRNSWGPTWGLAGNGWLHDPYLAPQLEMTGTIT
jgi:hypothetical protein